MSTARHSGRRSPADATMLPAASTVLRPSSATIVKGRVRVSPPSGRGADTRTSAVPTSPGATSRVPGRNPNRTACSGSVPCSRTDSGNALPRLSRCTRSRPVPVLRVTTFCGSRASRAVAIGAGEARCSHEPGASTSWRPSVATTVKARVACSPVRGSGACTWAGVARSTPAGTQSSAARNANPIWRSGSRPASRTHRSRLPARLSTTTCSSATGLSIVRSVLGSSRIRTGTSTGAADVSWSSRTDRDGPRTVVGRRGGADRQRPLGPLARGRRWGRDLHLDRGAAAGRHLDRAGGEGEPDDPLVVGARQHVPAGVVAAAVVHVHGEPPLHRVAEADDGRLGPDRRGAADPGNDQRDLDVGVHVLVALGAQPQPQPQARVRGRAGRTAPPARSARPRGRPASAGSAGR